MKENLVSIIIPVYNKQETIEYCLQSVIAQTYEALEIILIDDGSTDRSYEICTDFSKKDSRITVFHQENGGVSAARNMGIELSSGKYIMFLDSDDTLEPNAVSELIEAATKNGCDIVFCDYNIVKNTSHNIYTTTLPEGLYAGEERKRVLVELYTNSVFSNIGTKLYLRELIAEKVTFTKQYSICEDTLFALESLMRAESVYYKPLPLYNYIMVEGSLMHSYKKNFNEAYVNLMNRMREFLLDSNGVQYKNFINYRELCRILTVASNEYEFYPQSFNQTIKPIFRDFKISLSDALKMNRKMKILGVILSIKSFFLFKRLISYMN